jgi:hypothetical protein
LKKYLLLFIVFASFVSISSIEGIAQNISDTQVTIKMRNLGSDPSTGGSVANITITTNNIGNLVYVEDYYSVDSYGQPIFCCSSRYEAVMKDYIVAFDLKRPDHDKRRRWSFVNSKILLDRVIVYDARTGISGTYKSPVQEIPSYTNNSDVSAGRIKQEKQRIIEQYIDIVHDTNNNTNDIINIENIRPMYNVTNIEKKTQKVSAIGMPVVILMILSAYIFKRMNI